MNAVYPDTNALITLASQSRLLDALERQLPYREIRILEGVLRELESLAASNGKDGRAAKLAAAIVKKQDLKTTGHSQSHVDTALLAVAGEDDVIITLDKELQKRAKAAGIGVFTIARTQLREVR